MRLFLFVSSHVLNNFSSEMNPQTALWAPCTTQASKSWINQWNRLPIWMIYGFYVLIDSSISILLIDYNTKCNSIETTDTGVMDVTISASKSTQTTTWGLTIFETMGLKMLSILNFFSFSIQFSHTFWPRQIRSTPYIRPLPMIRVFVEFLRICTH